MTELIAEFTPKHLLSVLAAFFGCAALYLLFPKKVSISEVIKSIIVAMMMGFITMVVSANYFKNQDEFMYFAVYPFAAGFSSPYILRGYILILIKFATNPYTSIEWIVGLIAKLKGGDWGGGNKKKDDKRKNTKDNQDKSDKENECNDDK